MKKKRKGTKIRSNPGKAAGDTTKRQVYRIDVSTRENRAPELDTRLSMRHAARVYPNVKG